MRYGYAELSTINRRHNERDFTTVSLEIQLISTSQLVVILQILHASIYNHYWLQTFVRH